jgi:hypothetical protein
MLPKPEPISTVNLLANGMLHNAKNVQNGDKFEKFELLKERFKSYRENMIKIGFENMMANSQNDSCCNTTDTTTKDKTNCYCQYYAKQQSILTEIANLNSLEQDIKEIRDYLRDTRKKLEGREYKTKLASDWKLIALVLDRTFFCVFLFVTIITLVLMFPRNTPYKGVNLGVLMGEKESKEALINNLAAQLQISKDAQQQEQNEINHIAELSGILKKR